MRLSELPNPLRAGIGRSAAVRHPAQSGFMLHCNIAYMAHECT
jgi:hypothetical protein